MPVNMERRYKKGSAPWRAQQLTLARRELNRKRSASAEYREVLEDAEREGKPPLPPLAPFTMKRSDSNDLFADNREFEEGNEFGSSKKEAESRRRNKREEKREKAEREEEKAEAAARETRKRARDKERRRMKEFMLLVNNFMPPPHGVQHMAPPFYPPPLPPPYAIPGWHDYPPPHTRDRYNSGYQAPPVELVHTRYNNEYEPIRESIPPRPHSMPLSRSKAFRASTSNALQNVHREEKVDYDQPLDAAERGEGSYKEPKKVDPPPVPPQEDGHSQRYPMVAPSMRRISSSHPLLQPSTPYDKPQKRSSDESSSDMPSSGMPSSTTGSLDPVDASQSHPPPPRVTRQMSNWNRKDGVSASKKARKVRVQGAKPSPQHQPQRRASKSKLLFAQESPVTPEEVAGPTRFHSIDNALEEINQAMYLELELMLANMNASLLQLADDAHRDTNRCSGGSDSTDIGLPLGNPNTDRNGLVALDDMPRRLRDIMLTRKPSMMGLDVDIGLKDTILHVDVTTAFQAMEDESNVNPGDFDFNKEVDYSEGLSAVCRRRDSSASVFHW